MGGRCAAACERERGTIADRLAERRAYEVGLSKLKRFEDAVQIPGSRGRTSRWSKCSSPAGGCRGLAARGAGASLSQENELSVLDLAIPNHKADSRDSRLRPVEADQIDLRRRVRAAKGASDLLRLSVRVVLHRHTGVRRR